MWVASVDADQGRATVRGEVWLGPVGAGDDLHGRVGWQLIDYLERCFPGPPHAIDWAIGGAHAQRQRERQHRDRGHGRPRAEPDDRHGERQQARGEEPNCAWVRAPRSSAGLGVSRTRGPGTRVTATAAPHATTAVTTSGSHSSPSTDAGRPAIR